MIIGPSARTGEHAMPYDVTLIKVRPNTHPQALPRIERWLKDTPWKGEFLACLASDIGALNEILLLHHYASEAELAADRDRAARAKNPFGILDLIAGIRRDTYVPFPFIDPIRPGRYGPV